MFPAKRHAMFAAAGLLPPQPNFDERRRREFVDDRVEPKGKAQGMFRTHAEWVNKASSWIGHSGMKCYDALGRRCRQGEDFARAEREDAFPVKFYGLQHFGEPTIPTAGQFVALDFLAEIERPVSIKEIRAIKGAGRVTWEKLEALLGEGCLEGESTKRLTKAGRERTSFLADCRRRASYVY